MEKVTIGGRTFSPVSQDLTANQDDFISVQLRRAGAQDLLERIGKTEDGRAYKDLTPEESAEELLTIILDSQRKPFLLAGCLTEEGTSWTRDAAIRNAKFFGEVTDPKEKELLTRSIVALVVGFFLSGALSLASSRKSSNPSEKDRLTKSAARGTSGRSRR